MSGTPWLSYVLNVLLFLNHDNCASIHRVANRYFSAFSRNDNGMERLEAMHVDTGMGLERIVSVVQGHSSNYDIDAFQPILKKISEAAFTIHCYDCARMQFHI